jgi:hypothetical protein
VTDHYGAAHRLAHQIAKVATRAEKCALAHQVAVRIRLAFEQLSAGRGNHGESSDPRGLRAADPVRRKAWSFVDRTAPA